MPGGPYFIPVLAILSCLYILSGLPLSAFLLFGGWIAVAALAYAFYGYRHSVLRRGQHATGSPGAS